LGITVKEECAACCENAGAIGRRNDVDADGVLAFCKLFEHPPSTAQTTHFFRGCFEQWKDKIWEWRLLLDLHGKEQNSCPNQG
jgi:hypothetical protein